MRKYITPKAIGIALIFFAIPLLINFLSCIPAPFQSWSKPSEWTVFWGQYISGFAAFAMLYVAWRTLLTTKEANRPYLIVDIVERRSIAYIRCRNIGHTTAQNIKLSFSAEQINGIRIPEVRECFESIISTTPFVLEPNGKRIWEVFCIPSFYLDHINEYLREREKTYEFKGKRILRDGWHQNEDYFKSIILNCTVTYDGYSNDYNLDYNNRLFDYEPAQLISDSIIGITTSISQFKWPFDPIKEKYCNDGKDK